MVAKSTDRLRLITTAGTVAELQENNSNVTFKKTVNSKNFTTESNPCK